MTVGKGFAAVLLLVFLIFSLFTLMTWAVGRDLLNADLYVETLDESGLFELPYRMIRQGDIPEVGGILLTEGPLSVVSGADLEAVARELAPPEWLRAQLEEGIRDVLAVAESSDLETLPDLTLSLREIKTRALGAPGDRALHIIVNALPVCAPGEAALDMSRDVPVCTPADLDTNAFVDELKAQLTPYVSRVPDTYRVQWQPDQQDTLEDLQRAGRTLDQLQVGVLILVALNAALLALIWLLAVRSPAEWLRWTGVPLLLLGGLAVLAAWLPPRLVETGLEHGDLWSDGNIPATVGETLEQAVLVFSVQLLRPVLQIGVLLLAVGLLLTLISPLFPGRRSAFDTR